MDIYMIIGSTFAFVFALIWVYTIGLTLYRQAAAYINGYPAVRNEYLRLLLEGFTEGTPSLYTSDRRRYQEAGLDYNLALTGENFVGILFIGGLIVITTYLLWPISLTVLTLRGLRRYNTNEEFHKLFERKARPVKIIIPKPRPRQKVIKGLD